MLDKDSEVCLALAGVCQAAKLVQDTARKGSVDEDAFRASISSIIITNPENTEQVFGGLANMRVGLETLISQLGNDAVEKDAEVTRYIASILGLERKLAKRGNKMNELAERISQIQRQCAHMELFDTQMQQNLASVYSDVISPVAPKIQVAGNPAQLRQENNQHKVRAMLLAGVRAAVLWRQLGGKRRHILFARKQILKQAQQLLQNVNHFH